MNTVPCGQCQHFDPVLSAKTKKDASVKHGWCVKRSVYPRNEGPGQVFPKEAVRDDSAVGKPFIVRAKNVLGGCADAIQVSKVDPVIEKRKQQALKNSK